MHYGYCSVSTYYQNIESQKNLILSHCPDATIITADRSEDNFSNVLNTLKDGDILYLTDIIKLYPYDDIGEKGVDIVYSIVLKNYQSVFAKGADIVILNFPYLNSSTFRSAIVNNHVKDSSFVEMAVSEILENQIKTLLEDRLKKENLRRNSIKDGVLKKHPGNKKGTKYNTKKSQPCKEFIKLNLKDFGGEMTNEQIIKELGIGRNTYFKYKSELIASLSDEINKTNTKIDTVVSRTAVKDVDSVKEVSTEAQEAHSDVSDKKADDKPDNKGKTLKKVSEDPDSTENVSEKVKDENSVKKKDMKVDQIEGQTSLFDFI